MSDLPALDPYPCYSAYSNFAQCGWTGPVSKIAYDLSMTVQLPRTPNTQSLAVAHYADCHFDKTFERSRSKRLRRSSTSRSIENHSNAEEPANEDQTGTLRGGEGDRQVDRCVAQQLQRVRSRESTAAFEDEIETQADEQA